MASRWRNSDGWTKPSRKLAEAVRLRPEMAVAHMHLGIACATTGRMDQARRELTEAVRIDPKSDEARAALARYFK